MLDVKYVLLKRVNLGQLLVIGSNSNMRFWGIFNRIQTEINKTWVLWNNTFEKNFYDKLKRFVPKYSYHTHAFQFLITIHMLQIAISQSVDILYYVCFDF